MNYFAHGRRFVHQPFVLAGTALPDWLNVVDRRVRARGKTARIFVDHADSRIAELAKGIVQHHQDDNWFHQSRAFGELSLQFTLAVRDRLAPDNGFRPSFLGHILVELLLDACLIEEDPGLLGAYYRAVDQLDPGEVASAVGSVIGQPVESLRELIPRFVAERFLYDYLDDAKLLTRLNHVMRRVGLAALPEDLVELFPAARQEVARRRDELLAGEMSYADSCHPQSDPHRDDR